MTNSPSEPRSGGTASADQPSVRNPQARAEELRTPHAPGPASYLRAPEAQMPGSSDAPTYASANPAYQDERRMKQLRKRRRLRVSDVTVVEESALRKAVWGVTVGNLMEWYDVGVYGYVAVIIGQLFLPDSDPHVQNLFALGVFAVTFVARPLGGVILGQLGDRLGRKEVLAYTLLMMATATFMIGVLPTYAAVGAAAPVLLIGLKLIQGFSTGGEYAGATTFITEYAPDKKRGFYAALLDWGSYMGFAVGAAAASALQLALSDEQMLSWGWRLPFLVALPLGIIALYFRSRIEDTPAFILAHTEVSILDAERQLPEYAAARPDSASDGGSIASLTPEGLDNDTKSASPAAFVSVAPDATSAGVEQASLGDVALAIAATDEGPKGVRALVRTYWRQLAVAFTLVAAANTVAYALTSYMPTYLTTTLGYDAVHGNLLTMPVLVLLSFLAPTVGWFSDRIGRKTILFGGSVLSILGAIPAFLLMAHGQAWSTLLGLSILALAVAMYVGNIASSVPALFPTTSRYGGMGISYNLATAIFGGTAGFIMEALVGATGQSLAPAFWVIFTSIAGFVAICFMPESARKPLPGSMPSVGSEGEAQELVDTQESNPDLDVRRMFATAPRHMVDTDPTVAEAEAELEVALATEREARLAWEKTQRASHAARLAVAAARTRARSLLDDAEPRSGNASHARPSPDSGS